MSQEKAPYDPIKEDHLGEQLTDIHSSKPEGSMLEKIKNTYLSDSVADQSPSEESIEQANGLEHPKPIKPSSLL